MVHTRRIAAEHTSRTGRSSHDERDDEQVTGSLERVRADSPGDQRLDEVRDVAFPVALRGYEREAVDAYVKRVSRLLSDLESSRSPDAAVRRALEQVGEETTGILQRAQETANDITARSRASADDRIREAERDARALTAEAEDRVRELEADYGRIWAERDRLIDEVRDLAERLLATADDASERYPTSDEQDAVPPPPEDTASLPALEPGRREEAELAFGAGVGGDVPLAADDEPLPGEPPELDPGAEPPGGEPVGRGVAVGFGGSSDEEVDFGDVPEEGSPDRGEGPAPARGGGTPAPGGGAQP